MVRSIQNGPADDREGSRAQVGVLVCGCVFFEAPRSLKFGVEC